MAGRMIKAWLRGGVVALMMIGAVPTGLAWAQDDQCPKKCPPGEVSISTGPKGCTCVKIGTLPAPTTKADQAMISVGQTTFLFAVNQDNGHVLFTFWVLGGGTQGWSEVGTKLCCGDTGDVVSNVAIGPTVTAVGNFLFLTITDSNGRIFLNQGTPPNAWVGWQAVH